MRAANATLGHATATLTLDQYGLLYDDELDALGERIDGARTEFLNSNAGFDEFGRSRVSPKHALT